MEDGMKRGVMLLFLSRLVIEARASNRELLRHRSSYFLRGYWMGKRDGYLSAARHLKVRLSS